MKSRDTKSAPRSASRGARAGSLLAGPKWDRQVDMGFRVWIPRSDRGVVTNLMRPDSSGALIDVLPLNYDDATLKTVEQIDVI
jgi:hypothetical protein